MVKGKDDCVVAAIDSWTELRDKTWFAHALVLYPGVGVSTGT